MAGSKEKERLNLEKERVNVNFGVLILQNYFIFLGSTEYKNVTTRLP